jgi:hypothetical protein
MREKSHGAGVTGADCQSCFDSAAAALGYIAGTNFSIYGFMVTQASRSPTCNHP